MSRFVVAEQGHVVNILAPVDINGGVSSDVFSMKDASHATIIVQVGVSAATCDITVEECDNFTPTTHTEIAFAAYKEETADGDTLGSREAITSSGFTISGNNGIFYVFEIDAEELTEGYPNLRISFSNPGASVIASAVAILSGLAYQGDQTRTQIA
ncbi:MAG: hypothetical protein WC364_13125 [Eubacteriales bacterium]|jgi:hypothetical protein